MDKNTIKIATCNTSIDGYPSDDNIRPTILVVDDSKVSRAYMQTHLEKEGYKVITAADGAEAIKLMPDTIEVVLLDLHMPRVDGMAVLRYMHEHCPEIPAIMITESQDLLNAVEAMKQGALDYLTKPVNPVKLLATIDQALTIRNQARRLRQVEMELAKSREYEIAIASRIQQTLLLGGKLWDFNGIKTGELSVASKKIDGDFYDFHVINEVCVDVIVGDVMGKGIPAALLGAAAKQHIMSCLYYLMRKHGSEAMPSPEEIVTTVHAQIIGKLKDLDTFFTLCYARFDLAAKEICFVDCGHMRTIHYHKESDRCSLLQGDNMPLGFPGEERFQQVHAPFDDGDLFFFYSDGLTESRNPDFEFYGEDRLVDFVHRNAHLEPQDLCQRAWKEAVSFAERDTFTDDLTCVAIKIDLHQTPRPVENIWKKEFSSELDELENIRNYIVKICKSMSHKAVDDEKIKIIEIAITEVTTNIIRHAYQGKSGNPIVVEIEKTHEDIFICFYDWGVAFDFADVPGPVFDETQEGGFGLHIIANTADEVRYTRDNDGKNCARLTFSCKGGK